MALNSLLKRILIYIINVYFDYYKSIYSHEIIYYHLPMHK